jgi:hypothetical protein
MCCIWIKFHKYEVEIDWEVAWEKERGSPLQTEQKLVIEF